MSDNQQIAELITDKLIRPQIRKLSRDYYNEICFYFKFKFDIYPTINLTIGDQYKTFKTLDYRHEIAEYLIKLGYDVTIRNKVYNKEFPVLNLIYETKNDDEDCLEIGWYHHQVD